MDPSYKGEGECIFGHLTPPNNFLMSSKNTEKQAGAHLEASFILTSFHVARRYCTHCQKRRVIINITQLQTLQPTTVNGLQDAPAQ